VEVLEAAQSSSADEALQPPEPPIAKKVAAEAASAMTLSGDEVRRNRGESERASLDRDAPLYPLSPSDVPPDLIQVSAAYRLRVLFVLGSLLLFVALYVALVIASGYLVYWAVVYPIANPNRATVILKVGLIGCSVVLFLFLLKGLFKRQKEEKELRKEISESEHPELFEFIYKLCDELAAPVPHRVYVSPEVNAAVFYHSSFLSLFLPTPKNLLIGLGLVNVLNLSEFKAVLAHEFGHFAQSSMKVGRYVYSANRVITDMVFGRDWLDELLTALRRSDIRIAVFAWACLAVVWVLRKTLEGIFRAINFANSALSRQMEFNADLVAVSVTGSDALICGLARLDFANQALMQAWQDLSAAADHHLYTRDLFFHQNHAASYLRKLHKDSCLGEPPAIPDDPDQFVQIFQPGDEGIPLMWASHPSNYDREQNAKGHYIRGIVDERSPWLLFGDPQDLRERVTRSLYRRALKLPKNVALTDAETVQAFIDDEHAETTYDERYHGAYNDRHLELDNLDELVQDQKSRDDEAASIEHANARLYDDELKSRLEDFTRRREEHQLLQGLEDGQHDSKDFEFRGRQYRIGEAKKLRKKVERELDEDRDWLKDLDRRVFRVHYRMARQLSPAIVEEFIERYRFHRAVQSIVSELSPYQYRLVMVLQYLASKSEMDQADFEQAFDLFREAYRALERCLTTARPMRLPALKNINDGERLGSFLLQHSLVRELIDTERSLDGRWIGRFMEQFGEVCERAQRIHSKSQGGILALQEKIALEWRSGRAAGPPHAMGEAIGDMPRTAK
jgi:Zn-dependent protease with chaperone function